MWHRHSCLWKFFRSESAAPDSSSSVAFETTDFAKEAKRDDFLKRFQIERDSQSIHFSSPNSKTMKIIKSFYPVLLAPLIMIAITGGTLVMADFGSDFEAGVQAVLDDPEAYGLFSEDSILDINLNGRVLKVSEEEIEIGFAIEGSADLDSWEILESSERTFSMEGKKGSFRLRAKPLRTLTHLAVMVCDHPHFGPVLADRDGFLLYRLVVDLAGMPPVVHESWPSVPAEENASGAAEVLAAIGVGTGGHLIIDGFPVYRFSNDSATGEGTGQGAGAVWWLINPDGSLNKKETSRDPEDPGGPGKPPGYEPGDPPLPPEGPGYESDSPPNYEPDPPLPEKP